MVVKIFNLISFILAPCLTGILMVLAFPQYDFHWLAWIAIVPLLLEIRRRRPWQAFFAGWLAGLVFFVGASPWVRDFPVTKLASYLGYLYLGIYLGFFSLFLTFILRRTRLPLLTAAPILVAFEYGRSNFFFLAFPTILLGHSQYLNLPFVQIASVTGVYGLSFIIVLANAAIADLIVHYINRRKQKEPLNFKNPLIFRGAIVLAIIIILWGTGYIILPTTPSGKSLSVAVVQGNIPQEVKWDRKYREQILSRYATLTEEAAKSNPQLIAWPEASTPGFVLKDVSLLQRMVSIVRRSNAHLLVGSAEYPKFDKTLAQKKRSGNTALFFSPEGKVLGQYIKIRLVPFGEYVPLEGTIRWPESIVSKTMTAHVNGKEFTILNVDGTRFCTLICWEILFPDLSRKMVEKGAEFVVNISNEAWFGKSAVPYQILSMSVFRAVENRVNVIRATNTGISGFIDPYGRITGKINNGGEDIFVTGTLIQQIRIPQTGTFYTRYGDLFAYGCIAFSLGLMIWGFFNEDHHPTRHPL